MSMDDYAQHIYQKHRLAISLAMIRTKPPDLTMQEYIDELKIKVDETANSSVCSDDFVVNDDDFMTTGDDVLNNSETILKDFNMDEEIDDYNNDKYNEDDMNDGKALSLEDLSQTTYCESQTQYNPNILHDNIFCENNNTTYMDIEDSIGTNIISKSIANPINNKESNVRKDDYNIKILNNDSSKDTRAYKSINKAVESANDAKNTEGHIETNINTNSNINNKCPITTDTNYDSQNTILYSVHGFTQNYTHYSPSQDNINIPNNLIFGPDSKKGNNFNDNTRNYDISTNKTYQHVESDDKTGYIRNNQDINLFSQANDTAYNEINIVVNNNDSFNNISYTASIKNHKEPEMLNDDERLKDIEVSTQLSQRVDEYFRDMTSVENMDDLHSNTNKQLTEMDIITEIYENSQQLDILSTIQNDFEHEDTGKYKTVDNAQLMSKDFDNRTLLNEEIENNKPTNVELTNKNDENTHSDIETLEIIPKNDFSIQENDLEKTTEEVIPFKVLEELSKVKKFLSKQEVLSRRLSTDGYSTDSGYRSDSQIRSSNRSALQLSCTSLNQSAYSLFNYIMQCPCTNATREITNEIAQTLGELIDKLHGEEKYPPFLEELLDNVDSLLLQVYEGDNIEENEFLTKEENTQRLCLLNNSIHIQKHTIEKISNILQTFHSKITEKDSSYELTNINETENIAYIFHILAILLKRYINNKNKNSLSQKCSQEDQKTLKKSSITEIWKKKWNPNYKEEPFEGSKENKCVLKECSNILNKIIVDCVNEYSLVAFSALKCFNLIQA